MTLVAFVVRANDTVSRAIVRVAIMSARVFLRVHSSQRSTLHKYYRSNTNVRATTALMGRILGY